MSTVPVAPRRRPPNRPRRAVAGALAAWLALATVGATAGCGPSRPPAARPVVFAPEPDPPYDLADDGDLAARRDALFAMAPGPARAALRVELAAALAGRARRWIDARRTDRLGDAVQALADLWLDEPAALAGELAVHRGLLADARAAFARAGDDGPAALTVVLLAAIDPPAAAGHRAELELILGYADDLARSRHGALGTGTGALEVLDAVNRVVDDGALVDRQLALLVERANRADASLTALMAGGARPTSPVYRLALQASFDLAVATSLHHRAGELSAILARLQGLGRDRRLATAAEALAAGARPEAWSELASLLRDRAGDLEDLEEDDRALAARAALALCLDGLVRFPDNATLLAAAGSHAAALDRLEQPIALYERARRRAPADPELARRLAELYSDRIGRLGAAARLDEAAARLADLRRFFADVRAAAPSAGWDDEEATALATYGRALVGAGRLPEARKQLTASVARAPTVVALEMLATVAWKKGERSAALRHLDAALALGGDEPADRYGRAKLLRVRADIAEEAGQKSAASDARVRALGLWADLGRLRLPAAVAGERLVESARLLWGLGRPTEALEVLEGALDSDRHGADTFTSAVTFLLAHGHYDRARDAYYQALASDVIGDYSKVYMGLWILADGRRRGLPDDRNTVEYLRGRDGPLWYDDLARMATGRADAGQLAAGAGTRAKRTELSFYLATLGLGGDDEAERRRRLDEVVASDLVLFFEYDLARRYLARPAP